MNLRIGENLKRLRREKDLTQEELAAHLGISFQAISKWERDESYPDITILPALSNYFKISIDELVGMEEIKRAEEYERINKQWLENRNNNLHKENVKLMKDALKFFPNDALLLVQLSSSLERLDGTDAEKMQYLRESISVQEQILRGEDSEVRNATLYNICFAYWKIGEYEKAIKQAEKLPNFYKSRENALVYLLTGEEKREIAKSSLEPLAWSITHQLTALYETENDESYLEKAEKIREMLLEIK
ncbi:MAG: helix-turn-helix transcriptional regulator [Clostridia bacterium]|nr:helix-turn-helix transcriptional regulator [Clostridia bacterium]